MYTADEIRDLEDKKEKLFRELNRISKILEDAHKSSTIQDSLINTKKIDSLFHNKGDKTWKTYIYEAIKYLGGNVKINHLINIIVLSNNGDYNEKRIRTEIGKRVIELVKEKKIYIYKNENKRIGYTYVIRKNE